MARGHRANRPVQRPPSNKTSVSVQKAPFFKVPPIVNGFYATLDSPVSGFSTPDRTPNITVTGNSTILSPVDIQVEWRRQETYQTSTYPIPEGSWSLPPVYTNEVLGAISGTPQFISAPTDLEYKTWWYRARAGNKTTNTWSTWTTQKWLDVRPVLGSTTHYIDLNIGVTDPPLFGAYVYIDMNVGLDTSAASSLVSTSYIDMNVGVQPKPMGTVAYTDMNVGPVIIFNRAAVQYADMNVRSDITPTPHIWWIRPEQGRWGYGFNIYGHGFGSFQNEYDGVVKLGDFTCQVVEWQEIPAVSPPDTIVRADDPEDDIIKPEHGWIFVIVPSNSVTAMVRVILEDD
jgi:hypothetical protein